MYANDARCTVLDRPAVRAPLKSSSPIQVESETQSRAAADRTTLVKDLAHAVFTS